MYGHGRFDNEVNNIQKIQQRKISNDRSFNSRFNWCRSFDYINGQKGLHQDANGQVYSIDNDNGKNIYSFKVNIIEKWQKIFKKRSNKFEK